MKIPRKERFNLYNVKSFAATGNGTATDASAIRNAYDAAAAAGGGIVFIPAGTYLIDRATGLAWGTGAIELVGAGSGSILKAGTNARSQVINITIDNGFGRFADFVVDAASNAAHAIVQAIATETSVGTVFERVIAKGATGFQWVNTGCEDCTYISCETPGDEAVTGTVAEAFTLQVPLGAVTMIGNRFFGQMNVNAQLLTIAGGVAGPIHFTAGAANQNLVLDGVYVYDGGKNNLQAISTAGDLSSITATGCTFISQSQGVCINGNIAAGAVIALRSCQWVESNLSTPYVLLKASGAGSFLLTGGYVNRHGIACKAFTKVGTPTTIFVHPVVTYGVTTPATG